MLNTEKNNSGEFPSGQSISENVFVGAGWTDEKALLQSGWTAKQGHYAERAKYLFEELGHLPEL